MLNLFHLKLERKLVSSTLIFPGEEGGKENATAASMVAEVCGPTGPWHLASVWMLFPRQTLFCNHALHLPPVAILSLLTAWVVRVHIYIWAKRYLPKQARIIQTLLQSVWASLVAQLVKNLSAMQKTPVQFLKNL